MIDVISLPDDSKRARHVLLDKLSNSAGIKVFKLDYEQLMNQLKRVYSKACVEEAGKAGYFNRLACKKGIGSLYQGGVSHHITISSSLRLSSNTAVIIFLRTHDI